jgi:hypothetical protein
MKQSESIKNIAKALITFHLKVDTISKDSTNPFFKSKYASLSNILDAIATPLDESGLTFCQFPTGNDGLTTILMHADSGEFISADYSMKAAKDDPQGRGSALTYQRRYALSAILGLNIDEDDDGNTATHGGKTPKEAEDNNKQWLNIGTKQFDGAIAKLKAGTTTIAKIRDVMKVSKETESALLAAIQ